MESTTYTIDGKEFELKHYGVKGMKWGRRKARPEAVGNTSGGRQSTVTDEAARKAARKQKAIRAAKIGGAIVAAGLAAYGAKKASDVLKDKAYSKALKRGQDAIQAYQRMATRDDLNSTYNPAQRMGVTMDRVRKLHDSNYRYADRASRNTVAAVRELLGKNYELPAATLEMLGIKTFEPDRFEPKRVNPRRR